ncbi:hypothetical protein PIROE2DRAFT_64990 [Piromyces sp. E2]|nr:hypothetical protein PIROE2DRAFT_64990 [Piromyces sp. E2]|eukprot:OUM57470.1 hypothetical protein PIROE2DRAFT_64990 [Piromyces sp. E2]
MEDIIQFVLENQEEEEDNESKVPYIEFLASYYNPFLIWLLLVLFLNRNKWKRPIIYILIAVWFFNYASDFSCYFSNIYDYGERLSGFLDYSLEFIGQIIGDWYLLLRTKAITGNKKIPLVYVTCILYNLTKINGILYFYNETPPYDDKDNYIKFALILFVIQIFGVFYDIANIYYLKKNTFNKYKKSMNGTKNSFIEKLKHVSEFRIVISLILSLTVIFIFSLTFLSSYYLYKTGKDDNMENIDCISISYRQVYFNYYFMFIDQILLRFYAERKNPKFKISSTNSFMFKEEETSFKSNIHLLNNKIVDYNNCTASERYLMNLSELLESNSLKGSALSCKSSIDNMTDNLIIKI